MGSNTRCNNVELSSECEDGVLVLGLVFEEFVELLLSPKKRNQSSGRAIFSDEFEGLGFD